MTQYNTRRSFLQGVGSVSVVGLSTHGGDGDGSSPAGTTLDPTDLVIPTTAVPSGFEQYPAPDSNSFITALEDSELDVANADIAVTGYWRGNTQANPEWVLSSTAVVADGRVSRSTIETAAHHSYDEYVDAYDAETGPNIDFEQSHTRTDQYSDWGVDIFQRSLFEDPNENEEPVFTDRMRLQVLGNVVLGTIAFGPTDTDLAVHSLLDEYAAVQRTQYDTHGATT